MFIFFENLLSLEKCQEFAIEVQDAWKEKKLFYEGHDQHYGSSYGVSRLPLHEKQLHEWTQMIKEKSGYDNISEENSFSRIYFNGGKLKRHVDRHGLDITLSICIASSIKTTWPLYVEHNKEVVKCETKGGDGACILGTKMHHWRDDLVCADDEIVIQSFFHWRINNVK